MTLEVDAPLRAEDGTSALAPVLAIAQSEIRARWRALVLIGLLAGLVGATAVGSIALARRTTTAYDRLGEVTAVDDARGTVTRHVDLLEQIVDLPQVTAHWTGRLGVAQLVGENVFLGITAGPEDASPIFKPLVIEGRLPAESQDRGVIEIALRDDFQREFEVPIGTKVPVTFLTEGDYFRFDTGFEDGEVHGSAATIHVVGTVRVAGGYTTMPPAFASAATLRAHPDVWVGGSWFVRLAGGSDAFEAFAADVRELAADRTLPPEAEEFPVVDVRDTSEADVVVDNTALLLGRALLIFGAAALLVGGLAVLQALNRHHSATAGAREVERALGLTRSQQTGVRLLTGVVPAVLGAAIALAGALGAATIEPIGALDLYEPNPGTSVNVAIVCIGVGAVLLAVLAGSAATSLSLRRSRLDLPVRESSVVARATRFGGSPPAVVGLRFALEPGRAARAVPVRSAITGAMVGIAGVVGGIVFVNSLDRLIASPVRSAVPFDAFASDVTPDDLEEALDAPGVESVVFVSSAPLEVGGLSLDGHALDVLRGEAEVGIEEGRLPRTPDEIALGLRAARDLDVSAGDTVTVRRADGSERELAVVGTAVVPSYNREEHGLNAIVTREGLEVNGAAAPFTGAAVTATEGTDPDEVVAFLAERFEADGETPPVDVHNLEQLGQLPSGVAAMVGSVAVLALANALVVAVRRRHRDLSVLRAMGFTRRQTGATVVVMAVTIVAIGVVVGVPVGIAVGGSLWRATASGAFVLSDPALRPALLAVPVVGALLVAVVAAIVPAVRAAARRASDGLRAE